MLPSLGSSRKREAGSAKTTKAVRVKGHAGVRISPGAWGQSAVRDTAQATIWRHVLDKKKSIFLERESLTALGEGHDLELV